MCGFTIEKKKDPAGPRRDDDRTPVAEQRERTSEVDVANEGGVDEEQPRVAKRPPGRLPTR